jgi:hypothetical protein
MEPEVAGANSPDGNDETNIMQGAEPGSAAGQLLNLFLTARFARRNQDTIWMKALRNIKAVIGPELQLQDGWSRAMVNMTSPKVQTAAAIVNDVILPQGKDIWNIETTPEPYMPEFTEFLAQQNAQQGIEADFETFKNQIFLESQRRCANLKSKVRDGFAEGDFKTHLADADYDICAYGSGAVMGPFPVYRTRRARGGKKRGKYLYGEWQHVSIFDLYPDPGARSIEDCLYVCIRRVKNKAWLSKMRENGGFFKDRIDYILEHAPDGNWTPEPWETDMIIANNNNQMYTYRHRYVMYDFWIKKTSDELAELGVSEDEIDLDDPNKIYMVNVMVCNGQIVRAVTSDFHQDRIPVYVGQCRKNTHSIWGTGFPEMMFDSQAAGSACERAANDTMASIARPQTVIDISRCKMGTDAMKPHPGKQWFVNNSTGGANKPIDIFYPPNILKEILEREESLKAWSDEQTGIPRFLSGQTGEGNHNRTLGGAELQWNNANNPFKTVVSNIEKFILIPATDKMVDFYMTFEYSDEIDCDYKIVSTGLQGLVAKQARVASIMEFMKAVGNNSYWQAKLNDKRIGEIIEDAMSLSGEQLFLNDADSEAKMKRLQEQAQSTPPPTNPGIPLRDAKLKALGDTDRGTPAYPIALEAVFDDLGIIGPAAAAALSMMREESLTAHRQFATQADVSALAADVNPDGSGKDIPDAKAGGMGGGGAAPNGPTPPGWQPGQPGSIPPQTAPQAGPGGIISAPLPLGVASLGTPKAESLVQHPERYSASIPPGRATNPADVGGAGLPGIEGGKV